MILVGNQRANGRNLALHLMNARDNEHVTVHDVRGFVSDQLLDAFQESEAIALGTKCQQHLFSLSLNPPPNAEVSVADFEAAIAWIETALGLSGQPRAVVFHEKNARRHAHCVWSRIDATRMRGINLPHYKTKLQTIARELYRTHDWDMPEGFQNKAKRDLNSFDRIEAAQAKSAKRDPKELKALLRELWERSDSRAAFRAALLSEGFVLAQGSRRAFVAVDEAGKTYSLSRWTGAGAKALRQRFGLPGDLPNTDEARRQFPKVEKVEAPSSRDQVFSDMVERHATARAKLAMQQEAQRIASLKDRQSQLPKGLKAAWAKLTGQYETIIHRLAEGQKHQHALHQQAMDQLIAKQMVERRAHQVRFDHAQAVAALDQPTHPRSRDRRQFLVLSDDAPLPSRMAVEFRPETILTHLSDKSESFTDDDIASVLRSISPDVGWCRQVRARLQSSSELVPVSDDTFTRYTTRDYVASHQTLLNVGAILSKDQTFKTNPLHVARAINLKNQQLTQVGAALTGEQTAALEHMMSDSGLACVVGVAGAGKSTLLDAARVAWQAEGRQVVGAALAGKAADGLEQSSGIHSRTLAALEKSWLHGLEPVAPGTVVVIDEVGMVGTRQLSRVLAKLSELRCKVVLVGDPDQLQPIEAGTPFRDLVMRHEHAKLSEVRRQKDDWQRRASVQLSQGDVQQALDAYGVRGHIKKARSTDAAIAALVENYLSEVEIGQPDGSRLALAHRRKDVFAINQGIRSGLVASGSLKDEHLHETNHGPRVFAHGDRVLFTRNDKPLGLRNGMLGTVMRVDAQTIRVRLDDDKREVSIDTRVYGSLDHGYAVSIHKSQGCTVDRTFVLGGTTMDRHLTYVAMTRHREEVRLFTTPKFMERSRGVARDHDRRSYSGPTLRR